MKDKLKAGLGAFGGMIMKAAKDKMDGTKEANLGKADNPKELDEKCFDDADACEVDEPIEKKIMRQKEAKLGESDVKADPRGQCFDDGVNCDVTWDVSEPAVDTRKNVNP